MKQSERITNAIVETLLGPQPHLSGIHPLHKSPCGFCPAMVCERDMKDHIETFHMEDGDRQPDDNEVSRELEPLFPREEHDEEDSSQSESEAFRNAK